jgi:hypothetical protein
MTSTAQLAANRANAQLSTGPTSVAGKQTVGQNALKHGLTGRVHAALPGEEGPFEQYTREVFEAFAPVGIRERELAQDIAADRWRLKRARSIENALFTQAEIESVGELAPAQAQAQAWIERSSGLQRIALYAARIQRALDKNTASLDALQSVRKAAFEKAREEAVVLTQLAECEGQPYNPAPDFPATPEDSAARGGFVYSAPEIARMISRAGRLELARALVAPPVR